MGRPPPTCLPLSSALLAHPLHQKNAYTLSHSVLLLQEVALEDFPLPTLGPWLRAIAREVTHGRGFQLIKGE